MFITTYSETFVIATSLIAKLPILPQIFSVPTNFLSFLLRFDLSYCNFSYYKTCLIAINFCDPYEDFTSHIANLNYSAVKKMGHLNIGSF